MSCPFHVLFVAGCWYPSDDEPVSGIFIRRHAEAVARDHRVTVLRPVVDRAGGPARLRWVDDGTLRELWVSTGQDVPGPLGLHLGAWRAGRTGVGAVLDRLGRPELVHFHVVPSAALALAVMSALPRLPVVVTEHWTGYLPGRGPHLSRLRRLYTRWLTRRAATVTTVSEHLARVMVEHGFTGSYQVVPNVVDTDRFRPRAERRRGPFRALCVCAVRPVKRVPDIVRAVARLRAAGTDLELHVVGDGPDRPAAEAAAAVAGGNGVVFHGQLDGAGVAAQMADADALVLFSDFENSPCVIGEALACGCPVVATRVAGVPEHLGPEHGVLVEVGDVAGLEAALAELAAGRRSFDREQLRRYALATFSPAVVGARFSAIYRECLARSSARIDQ